MIKILGISAIISGAALAVSALWATLPLISEPTWYSNGWLWILATLMAAGCSLIVWIGVQSIRKPNRQNIETSGCISALFAISAVRVVVIDPIDHTIGRIVASIVSAALIACLFYLLIKTAKARCA